MRRGKRWSLLARSIVRDRQSGIALDATRECRWGVFDLGAMTHCSAAVRQGSDLRHAGAGSDAEQCGWSTKSWRGPCWGARGRRWMIAYSVIDTIVNSRFCEASVRPTDMPMTSFASRNRRRSARSGLSSSVDYSLPRDGWPLMLLHDHGTTVKRGFCRPSVPATVDKSLESRIEHREQSDPVPT